MLSTISEMFLYTLAIAFVLGLMSKPQKRAHTTVGEDRNLNSNEEVETWQGRIKSLTPPSHPVAPFCHIWANM